MKRFISLLSLIAIASIWMAFSMKPKGSVYDFKVKDIGGNEVELERYEGKVLLVVNVASKCGYTPQYADLQELYDTYSSEGLEVLGFPANDFNNQEPGTNDEISSFCTQKYGVTFPMFSKVSVKGADISPLYEYLTNKNENGVINAPVKWNFQKFLINREGQIVDVFNPAQRVVETKVIRAIEKELSQKVK